ncbi:MAG: glycine cleavage system protein GcvH [Deltaproteobacteria bacterium]|nr:glycine cleavage system protein GcvH [Deltaproteobacteria bacterium]MBI2341171.1 glycine cleavage system protein GcvH [Deltaproteobacteria bacterium]MBI2974346.1 glycine cleavage system protein GcvH [Deltaproteobacteria bacterium]
MEFPDDIKYTKEHEWVRVEGKTAIVGITDYAQDQLGDIVYVELPDVGEILSKGDAFGVVESVKSVSDVNSPVSGKVTETNDPLKENPETVNEDPYNEGWIVKLEMSDKADIDDLMSAKEYEAYVTEEKA